MYRLTLMILIGAIAFTITKVNAQSQYDIPGGGAIEMPPNCMAQFDYVNYCVAANIIQMGVTVLNFPQSEAQKFINTYGEQGIQCLRAATNWESCSRYLKWQMRRPGGLCRNYWERPEVIGEDAVSKMILERLIAQCGGAQ